MSRSTIVLEMVIDQTWYSIDLYVPLNVITIIVQHKKVTYFNCRPSLRVVIARVCVLSSFFNLMFQLKRQNCPQSTVLYIVSQIFTPITLSMVLFYSHLFNVFNLILI